MANVLLNPDELQNLKNLQNESQVIALQVGSIEIQRKELQKVRQQLFDKLDVLKQRQQQLGTELNQKYGEGSINLESGEFIKAS